jgi:hypothetical protein
MMDARLKDLWLKALRSGEYPQGIGYLLGSKGYCCIGVLCDTALKNNLVPPGVKIVVDGTGMRCGHSVADIPHPEAFGLPRKVMNRAIRMNDGTPPDFSHPQSFAEIADWLEAVVPVDWPQEEQP